MEIPKSCGSTGKYLNHRYTFSNRGDYGCPNAWILVGNPEHSTVGDGQFTGHTGLVQLKAGKSDTSMEAHNHPEPLLWGNLM